MTVLPADRNFARESLRLTRVPDAELARLGLNVEQRALVIARTT